MLLHRILHQTPLPPPSVLFLFRCLFEDWWPREKAGRRYGCVRCRGVWRTEKLARWGERVGIDRMQLDGSGTKLAFCAGAEISQVAVRRVRRCADGERIQRQRRRVGGKRGVVMASGSQNKPVGWRYGGSRDLINFKWVGVQSGQERVEARR